MNLKKLATLPCLLLTLSPMPIFAQAFGVNIINGTDKTFITKCSTTAGRCSLPSSVLPFKQINGRLSEAYSTLHGHIFIANATTGANCVIDFISHSNNLNLTNVHNSSNVDCKLLREGVYIELKKPTS